MPKFCKWTPQSYSGCREMVQWCQNVHCCILWGQGGRLDSGLLRVREHWVPYLMSGPGSPSIAGADLSSLCGAFRCGRNHSPGHRPPTQLHFLPAPELLFLHLLTSMHCPLPPSPGLSHLCASWVQLVQREISTGAQDTALAMRGCHMAPHISALHVA